MVRDHYYTVLDAGIVEHQLNNVIFRVLKLRNAFGNDNYKGEGSLAADTLFWDQVKPSEEKSKLLSSNDAGKEGSFFMLLPDYIKYFKETNVNMLEENGSYISKPLNLFGKNGIVFDLEVIKEGFYTIFVDQHDMKAPENV